MSLHFYLFHVSSYLAYRLYTQDFLLYTIAPPLTLDPESRNQVIVLALLDSRCQLFRDTAKSRQNKSP